MAKTGSHMANHQDLLEEAFCEYLRRVDAGENVDRQAFVSRYPDVAEALAAHIDSDSVVRRMAGPTYAEATAHGEIDATIIGNVQIDEGEIGHANSRAGSDPAERSVTEKDTVVASQPDDTHPAGTTLPGDIPAHFGRYRVEKLLGQGAMGSVYLAHDTQLDRRVALKIPKFDQTADTDTLERFYREARAVATLHHPNICPVYDVGEIDGQTFLSMAYIEGRPLSDYTKSQQKQGERSVAKLVMKLAQALQEAHEIGVVHRDLKPANIMVGKKGEPVVMDFGLARRLDSNDTRVTKSGTIVGTPAYMSPEQVEGDPDAVGPASDQYSLGVILYELLTGRLPFHGSVLSVIGQIAHVEPQSIDTLRSGVDPRLVSICKKMMAKKRQDRFENMAAVASAINAYLVESKTTAAPENQSLWDQTKAATPQEKVPEPTPRLPARSLPGKSPRQGKKNGRKPPKRKPFATVLIAATLTLLLAAGIFYFQSAEGTVRIEIKDPEVQVTFQDQTFTIDDNGTPIEVRPGKHKLLVKRRGLEVPTEEFTVSRNGDVAIQVTLIEGELKVLNDGNTIGSHKIAPNVPQALQPEVENAKSELRLVHKLERHTARIHQVAFAPDGNTAFSSGMDGAIIRWDVFNGKSLDLWKDHESQVWSIAILPDGKWLASPSSSVGVENCDFWRFFRARIDATCLFLVEG